MKRYNFLINTILFIIIVVQICSCKKDYLDVPPSTAIVRQQFVSDLKTTEQFLNGIFADLAESFYFRLNVIYADAVADNIKPLTGQTDLLLHYNWAQVSGEAYTSDNNMNSAWTSAYSVARNASFIIENIDRFQNENIEKATIIKGNAFALRALAHYQLVNMFAQPYKFTNDGSHIGVPYVISSDWQQPVSRQSVSEVYSKMIEDLNMAISLLPNMAQPKNALLITKNAATALLARIYLFKEDFQNAKGLAMEVSNAVPIMSSPAYPSKLFTQEDTEALLQLPPEQTNFFVLFPSVLFRDARRFTATNDLAHILQENSSDLRNSWVSASGSDWNITKFPTNVIPGFSLPSASYYFTIIRSSEMYLTAAESYAQLNMEDSARFFLDAIRQRANATASNSTATGPALLDSIYKERRKELCFENMRMYDLLRTGKGVFRLDAQTGVQELPYPSNKAIAPIPLIDVQSASLQQNVGY